MRKNRNREERLFGVLRWLLIQHRPPGMIGRAIAFSHRGGTKPDLTRQDDRWVYSSDGGNVDLDTAGVLKLMTEDHYRPQFVHIEPDLAGQLFQEAVIQAETSVRQLAQARREVEEILSSDDEQQLILPVILGSTALDRALRASISSIMLAMSACEAQVNAWASDMGGWHENDDSLPLARKCQALTSRANNELPLGSGELQELQESVKLRNKLVHSQPIAEPVPTAGHRAPVPGRTISEEARRACLRVRKALIAAAAAVGFPPPKYLAYCPPASANDDEAWFNAQVLTGVRPDPDFPPQVPQS